MGDLNGVGPELIVRILSDSRINDQFIPVIFGSTRVLSFYKKLLNNTDFNYTQVKSRGQYDAAGNNVVNCWEDQLEITPGQPAVAAGKAAVDALKEAVQYLKEDLIDALVTAPIDKHSIQSNEFTFKGHTDFLASSFQVQEPLMFLVSNLLRVALVTEHLPLREAASALTKDKLGKKIQLLEQSLRQDFGISKPRIAVLGLNPHAGDGGVIGVEDKNIIAPVVEEFRNKGKLVYGPFPADGFFGAGAYARFDAVLAMYHDQGLIPFKTLAFSEGVNFTAGLPVVRTSPDHGTAYDLAGKGKAGEESFRQALFTAVDIVRHRRKQK